MDPFKFRGIVITTGFVFFFAFTATLMMVQFLYSSSFPCALYQLDRTAIHKTMYLRHIGFNHYEYDMPKSIIPG